MDRRQRSSDAGQQHSSTLLTKSLGRRKSLFSFAAEFLKLRSASVHDDSGIEMHTRHPQRGKWDRFSSLRGFGDKFNAWGRSVEAPVESRNPSLLQRDSEPDIDENGILLGKRRQSLQNILGTVGNRFSTGRRKTQLESVWQLQEVANGVSLQERVSLQEPQEHGDIIREPVPKIPWILRLQEFKVDGQNSEPCAPESNSRDASTRRDSAIGLSDGEKSRTGAASSLTFDNAGNCIRYEKTVRFDDASLASRRGEKSSEDRPSTPNSYLCELIQAAESLLEVSTSEKIIPNEIVATETLKSIDLVPQFLDRAQRRDGRYNHLTHGQTDLVEPDILKVATMSKWIASTATTNPTNKTSATVSEDIVLHASPSNSFDGAEAEISLNQSFLSKTATSENERQTTLSPASTRNLGFQFPGWRPETTYFATCSDGDEAKNLTQENAERFKPELSDMKYDNKGFQAHSNCQNADPTSNAHKISLDVPILIKDEELLSHSEVKLLDVEQPVHTSRLIAPTGRGGATVDERYSDFSVDEFWQSEEDSDDHEIDVSIAGWYLLREFSNPTQSLLQTENLKIEAEESTITSLLCLDDHHQSGQGSVKTWAGLGQDYFEKYAPGTSDVEHVLRADIAVQNALFILGRSDTDDDGCNFSDEIRHRVQWQLCNSYSDLNKVMKRIGDNNYQVVQRIPRRSDRSRSSEAGDLIEDSGEGSGRTIHIDLCNLYRCSSASDMKTVERENSPHGRENQVSERKSINPKRESFTVGQEDELSCMLSPLSNASNRHFPPRLNTRMIGRQAQKSRLAGNGNIELTKIPSPITAQGLIAHSDSRPCSSQQNDDETDCDSDFGIKLERFDTDEVQDKENEALNRHSTLWLDGK